MPTTACYTVTHADPAIPIAVFPPGPATLHPGEGQVLRCRIYLAGRPAQVTEAQVVIRDPSGRVWFSEPAHVWGQPGEVAVYVGSGVLPSVIPPGPGWTVVWEVEVEGVGQAVWVQAAKVKGGA